MNKPLLLIGSACGLAMLYFGSPSAYAFCTQFDVAGVGVNCDDEGHNRATDYLRPVLRNDVVDDIWDGNYAQDDIFASNKDDGKRHFQSCQFATDGDKPGSADYIRSVYRLTISNLDPANPNLAESTELFGKLLHTAQDFYAHSNWIDLLNLTEPSQAGRFHLIDRTVEEWRSLSPLTPVDVGDLPVTNNIIVGQIPVDPSQSPVGALEPGWTVDQADTSETPIFLAKDGITEYRGLIVGWNEGSACPDVRAGNDDIIDEYSHDPIGSEVLPFGRTPRLTHGESKILGQYDHFYEFNLADAGYQAERPCHDDYPTYICLNRDSPGRPGYETAIKLAALQSAQEWCRLLHLSKDSEYGYAASSILMTLWARPHDGEPVVRDPITLGACATPPEVFAGKAGPIEVTVDPGTVLVNVGSPGSLFTRNLVFGLYTGDFRRSVYSQFNGPANADNVPLEPRTMCVKPADKLVATVWGADAAETQLGTLSRTPLRGTTWVLDGPDFQAPVVENQDLQVSINVTVGGEDPDGDGLSSACGETYYSTDPLVADTDGDGLTDGAEVNTYHTEPRVPDTDADGLNDGAEVNIYHTEPLVPDTDGDGLTDGAEVNTYHTNPLNPDTDNDGLTDGDEVNVHLTDPNHPDTDRDGLPDGIEVRYGTNPLLLDTDGDGLPDGQDVDWIQDVIASIPSAAIKPPGVGNRNAMLNLLTDAEALLLKGSKGNRKAALDKLMTLRSRIDGCGVAPDGNDWIVDCAVQTELRMLVDLLIANTSA